MKNKKLPFYQNPGFSSFAAALISILVGILLGLILLFVFDSSNAMMGFKSLVTSGFSSKAKFAKVLYQAAPLIMTGLSVGFAFKTGLFNIGATGQYTIGACIALICAIVFQCHWLICLLAAMVGGAVWGFFPGFFKAFFNVNEVITSIMFNWIGLFAVNFTISNIPQMLANYWGLAQMDRTPGLRVANQRAIIAKFNLDAILESPYMNISIFIAMFFALIMFVVLQKTTFGYELKACGLNKNASIYAGISAKRNIVFSMIISGALSGLAGGIYYLAGTGEYVIDKTMLAMGFNGIPVALLATSHPLGTIFSALFISYIQVGGDAMQPEFAKETIDIIIAAIIYLAAFSLLVKSIIAKAFSRNKGKEEVLADIEGVGGGGATEADILTDGGKPESEVSGE